MAFNRRTILKTAAGAATTLAATRSFAANCQVGPAPHDKSPKVWMDMDQIELDSAYDQSEYAPMIGQILKRYASRSADIRARLGRTKAFQLRANADRGARCISSQDRKRADICLRARRRLAKR
jgi:arylformamidase